ncbi:HRDC domain-containing protein [Entamoeba marina]
MEISFVEKLFGEIDNVLINGIIDKENAVNLIDEMINQVLSDLGSDLCALDILSDDVLFQELIEEIIEENKGLIKKKEPKKKIVRFTGVKLSDKKLESLENRVKAKSVESPIIIFSNYDKPISSPIHCKGIQTKHVWQFDKVKTVAFPHFEKVTINEINSIESFECMIETLFAKQQIFLKVKIDKMNNYRGIVCLIFLSVDTTVYVVHCSELNAAMPSLAKIFETPKIEKNNYGITTNNVFDLSVAIDYINYCSTEKELYKKVIGKEISSWNDWLIKPFPKYTLCSTSHDTFALQYISIIVRNNSIDSGDLEQIFAQSDKENLPNGRMFELERNIRRMSKKASFTTDEFDQFMALGKWREQMAKKDDFYPDEYFTLEELKKIVASGASITQEFSEVLPNNGMVMLFSDEIAKVLNKWKRTFVQSKRHNWLNVNGYCVKEKPLMIFKHTEWEEKEQVLKRTVNNSYDIVNDDIGETPFEKMILRLVLSSPSEEIDNDKMENECEEIPKSLEEIYKWSKMNRRVNKKKKMI